MKINKEKNFQFYKILFVMSALVTLYLYYTDYGKDFLFHPRVFLSLLFFILVYYYGVYQKKPFALFLVKLFVWLQIIPFIFFLVDALT
ncbi:MAG: hypothetical protein K0R71_1458 [Bacillales bacterium]|jgi:hypothetical protein|nr:hypothetical protein [Bacillales bacterium]